MQIAIFIVAKSYALFIAGYCLIPFAYLRFYKWYAIYESVYFIGHIVIIPMLFLWKPLILTALKIFFPLEKEAVEQQASKENKSLNNQHEKSN